MVASYNDHMLDKNSKAQDLHAQCFAMQASLWTPQATSFTSEGQQLCAGRGTKGSTHLDTLLYCPQYCLTWCGLHR